MLPERLGNQYFPLPRDYGELTTQGQREARIALCCGWYNLSRPTELIAGAEEFYWAFKFWKTYYRKGWQGNRQKYSCPTPEMHDDWVRLFAANPLLILTCFRDSGKTFIFGEEIPEFIISTRPHSAVQYTSSTEDLSEKQIRAVSLDLENNSLITADFGEMRPPRKSRLRWAKEAIELANGSSFYAISYEQKQRGTTQLSLRSLLQILDDPEDDQQIASEGYRQKFDDYLHNVFFPCADPAARRIWTNTLLDERSWAMTASKKRDSRFNAWESVDKYLAIRFRGSEGEWISRWPERFPVEMIEAMAGEGSKELGVVGYGDAAFAREFMNDPTVRHGRAFAYDPQRHTYQWGGDEDNRVLHRAEGSSILWKELEKTSVRGIGLDFSLGLTAASDLSAIVAGGIDAGGRLIVLQLWAGRERPVDVLQRALEIGRYWGARVFSLERVVFEQILIDMLEAEVRRRRGLGMYAPDHIHVITRGGGQSKWQRILSLQYRFADDLILIPLGGTLRTEYGLGAPALVDEIGGFTMTGTTRHDDCLDALVNLHDALTSQAVPPPQQPESAWEPLRRMRERGVLVPPEVIPAEAILGINEPGAPMGELLLDPDEVPPPAGRVVLR